MGELRGRSEAAVTRVEHRREAFGRFAAQHVRRPQGLPVGDRRPQWLEPARDRVREGVRLADDIVTPRVPGLDHRLEHLAERRQPVAGTIGEVRPGKKREPVRCGEHAHRPAAAPGGSLHRLHVDRVDVRPLLPVDLHAHEMPVHHLRGRRVRERLVTHDVAPVARRIADGDEKRPVELFRARECLVAPRVPVDRIAGVLAQVRACLAAETVHLGPPLGRRRNAFTLRNLWSEP